MARIVYGVMGDSRGHLTRSLAVAQAMEDHEFLFIGGGTVRELAQEGYMVEEVPMAGTIRYNNRVDVAATVANALAVFSRSRSVIKRVAEIIDRFDPHLILTDYEFFTPRAARRLGRPCISLDHQHVLTHCQYTPPTGETLSRLITCALVRGLYSAADRFLIISFFHLPPRDPRVAEVFPPVVRRAVKDFRPTPGEHGVVYLSDKTFQALLPILERRKRKFIIYGLGERPPRANFEFKKTSTYSFLSDMASCRYVISNAGHNLISEALYFGKPVLCFPRDFEYEQFLNAHFLSLNGFGAYFFARACHDKSLDQFESRLDAYEARVQQERFEGNAQIAARLFQLIEQGGH